MHMKQICKYVEPSLNAWSGGGCLIDALTPRSLLLTYMQKDTASGNIQAINSQPDKRRSVSKTKR